MPFETFEIIPKPHLKKEKEPPSKREVLPEHLEGFVRYLNETRERLKKEGVPVDENLRIDPEAFKKVYSPEIVDFDLKRAKEKLKEYEAKRPKIKNERAELLERYVVALFNKHFGEYFIVVRTSLPDDLFGHADNLIIDRETNIPICALDEVSVSEGPTFEGKAKKVFTRNLERQGTKGGVRIKYGFSVSPEGIKLRELKNVPLFYLALQEELLYQGIKEFSPSEREVSPSEKEILNSFFTSLQSQIAKLHSEKTRLSPEIIEKIDFFNKRLESLKEKISKS